MKLTDCQKDLGLEVLARAAYHFARKHNGMKHGTGKEHAYMDECMREALDEMEQEVQEMQQQEAEKKGKKEESKK